MQNRPEISLIIPVYNGEKYLLDCLKSVQNQTFKNWEAICINDGSKDNSLAVLQVMAAKDKRFFVINKRNEGVAATRNRGLKIAQGKYIMFLDQDDYLHPQAFEYAVKAMHQSLADVCQFRYRDVDQAEKIDYPVYNVKQLPIEITENPFMPFIKKKWKKTVLMWDKVYKAEIAKQVTVKKIQPCEDDIYTFEILNLVHKFAKLDLNLLYYRTNTSSVFYNTSNDEYHKIKLKSIDYMCDVVNELCKKNAKNTEYCLALRRYLTERYLFKEYILRPLRKKYSKTKTSKLLAAFENKLSNKFADYNLLRLRYKIILWFARRRKYKLARFISYL